jgi:FAD/FMN-containing dehydrogenase
MTTDTPARSSLNEQSIDDLRTRLLGSVLAPGDHGYAEARRVWNGVIDRHPALVVRCRGVADVVETVRFAREHPMPVSIRGGGHQVAGSAVCDDGIVIDLSSMTGVHVDPAARTARVQAGARWHDVDRATQLFGLATTGGEISITGVAGLTLGGGLGLLHRAFGLACDNLRSIEIVTADGVVRTASRHAHPDLFWAAKGAGRGLGVVTSFEFDLHPLGPDVAIAQVAYSIDDAVDVLRAWRDLSASAPNAITSKAVTWVVPAHPHLPPELHDRNVVLVVALYAGDPADSADALAPYRALAAPVLDISGTYPYAAAQSAFDFVLPEGDRYYWKSHFLDELTDDAIDTIVASEHDRANGSSFIVLRALGGTISDVGPDESAFAHRAARFNVSVDGAWTDPADDTRVIDWVRRSWRALQPFANGGVYLNFAGFADDGDVTPASTLGSQWARVEQVRADYDPDGLFAELAQQP